VSTTSNCFGDSWVDHGGQGTSPGHGNNNDNNSNNNNDDDNNDDSDSPTDQHQKNQTFKKKDLPDNALSCTAMGQRFFAPPSFDLSLIVADGYAHGRFDFSHMGNAVGHNGTYDFQRVRDGAGNTAFYSGYTPVSNIAVGAYLYGAGYGETGAGLMSDSYAFLNSANFGDPQQAKFRDLGWSIANAGKGSYSCSQR
jgi:hypothetical protein